MAGHRAGSRGDKQLNRRDRTRMAAKAAGVRLAWVGNSATYVGKRGTYTVTRMEVHRSFAQHGHHGRPTYSYTIALNGQPLDRAGTDYSAVDAILFSEAGKK